MKQEIKEKLKNLNLNGFHIHDYKEKKKFIQKGMNEIKSMKTTELISKKQLRAFDYILANGEKLLTFIFDKTCKWPYKALEILFLDTKYITFQIDFGKESGHEILTYEFDPDKEFKCNPFIYDLKQGIEAVARFDDIAWKIKDKYLDSFLNYNVFYCYFYHFFDDIFDENFEEISKETVGSVFFILNYPGFNKRMVSTIEPEYGGSISIRLRRPEDCDRYFKKYGSDPDFSKDVKWSELIPENYVDLRVFDDKISYFCVHDGNIDKKAAVYKITDAAIRELMKDIEILKK